MMMNIYYQVIKAFRNKFPGSKTQGCLTVHIHQGLWSLPAQLTQSCAETCCEDHCFHRPSPEWFTVTVAPGMAESIDATLVAHHTERWIPPTQPKAIFISRMPFLLIIGNVLRMMLEQSPTKATASSSLPKNSITSGSSQVRSLRSCLLYTSPSPRDGLLSR